MTLREALDASTASFAAFLVRNGRPGASYTTGDGQIYSVMISYVPDDLEIKRYHLWRKSVMSTGLASLHEVFDTLEEVELALLFEYLVRINAGWEPFALTGRILGGMSWHWSQRESRHCRRAH